MPETRHYGGQALIEGVMIRGPRHVCVACRRPGEEPDGPPTGDVFVQAEPIQTMAGRLSQRYPVARWPFLRGTLVLLESMELGSKGLRLSAAIALEKPKPAAPVSLEPASIAPVSGEPVSVAPVTLEPVVAQPAETGCAQPISARSGAAPSAHPEPVAAPLSGAEPLSGAAPRAGSTVAVDPAEASATVHPSTAPAELTTATAAGVPLLRQVLIGLAILLVIVGALGGSVEEGWITLQVAIRTALAAAGLAAVGYLLNSLSRREERNAAGLRTMEGMAVGVTMITGLSFGILVFVLFPSLVAGLLQHYTHIAAVLNLAEGCIRVLLFFGYLKLISRMPNIHRLFQYHGAEHQVIHVHENGLELSPENAARFPTIHPRCGTAFLAIVLVTSVIVFTFTGWQVWWLRCLIRLVLLPVIAGISYELLKWNSVRPNAVLKAFVAPGLWFQRITTQAPSVDQVQVAIEAMRGVIRVEEPDASTAAAGSGQPAHAL